MIPKPKHKRKRALNNPKPTFDDICRYCGARYAQTHEVYEGNGRRQLSIRYGMQVKVCDRCHKDIMSHPLTGRDLELKKEFQAKFELTGTREEFRRLFGKSYLEVTHEQRTRFANSNERNKAATK
jgi:hypothetical protein